MKIVLQKFIAESGYCSRRQAEELIKSGSSRITVNGEKASPGMRVDENDEVCIGGKRIGKEKKVYIILNKPKGYVCSNRNFKNELSAFDLLPREYRKKLHIAGRLDKNSRGLVLFTNDGDYTQKITKPKYRHEKKYIVKVDIGKNEVKEIIKKFRHGFKMEIEGKKVRVSVAEIEQLENSVANPAYVSFLIILTEGKKRQIREMFGSLEARVKDLQRVSIGGIELGDLKEGEWIHASYF